MQLFNNAIHLLLAAIVQQYVCYWLQLYNNTSVTGYNSTTMQYICYWLQLYNNTISLKDATAKVKAVFCEVTTKYFSIIL